MKLFHKISIDFNAVYAVLCECNVETYLFHGRDRRGVLPGRLRHK